MLNRSRVLAGLLFSLSAFVMSMMPIPTTTAQDKKAPPPPTVPATFPTLTTPANLGVKVGGTTDLVLTGTNLADVTGVWMNLGAKVTIPEGQKDATKLTVKVEVPDDGLIGLRSIRVATKAGISNAKSLSVDDLPTVAETEQNRSKATPQVVPNPCVVTGKTDAEASDFFKFPVQAGVPVTVEVLGRRLGSPLDPVVLLYDGNGKELAGVYADDTPGLQADARVTYTPKQAGDVIIEVRDTTYRGGADYFYRLRIGSFPGVTTAFPLAIERRKEAEISFTGPNAQGIKPVKMAAPKNPAITTLYATPKSNSGLSGWPVPVLISDAPQLTETEPNNDVATANKIPVPCGVSARFLAKNDVDHFQFAAKKGEKFNITALTYSVNTPTEVLMRILDAKGAEVARSNPQQALTKLDFTAPADGNFIIACEHLNYLSGPSEAYWLQVLPATPDFAVTVGLDRIEVPAGGVGLLPISTITKVNGFNAPIELSLNSGALSGKLTVPATATPAPGTPLYMVVTAKPDAKPGPVVTSLTATAKIDGKDAVRNGIVADIVKAGYGNLPNPPHELATLLGIAISPTPPFTLSLVIDKPETAQGGTLKGKVVAKRAKDFDAEIVISQIVLPANVTAKLKPIAKGATEAEVEITAAANATVGVNTLILRGSAKVAGKDLPVVIPPANITVTEAKKKEEPKKEEKKEKKK